MKKKLILIILIIAIIIAIPYIYVEVNTAAYGNIFENEYQQTNMISKIEYYKVFYFTGKAAKVYYVEENHSSGNFLWFEKEDSDWKMVKWTTVWSKDGSASGITYPIYR